MDMVAAMSEVKEGKGTLSSVARKYHVPMRTLENRIKGRVKYGKKSAYYQKKKRMRWWRIWSIRPSKDFP